MKWAYYNEFDPFAAEWLRRLIKEGHIAPGEVDERSIGDVAASDVDGFAQVHWFAGIGGWSYAFRRAGWPDDRPVWTGSCPCQPFSLAGAQRGFDDSRHLWPVLRNIIAQRRPTVFFGEQVASATAWLGLVRGDLEALDYAVGAIPIQAASAGADHLRDRYWFVGHDTRLGRGEGRPQYGLFIGERAASARYGGMVNPTRERRNGEQNTAGPHGRPGAETASGVGLADANDTGPQGRTLLPECASEWAAGADSVANTDKPCTSEEWEQRSGEQRGAGGDQEPCHSSGMANASSIRRKMEVQHQRICETESGRGQASIPGSISAFEWVIGADGKARRVKPGICLLAHGFPNRVGILRGFGNAIDSRPASAFISAYMDTVGQ